MKPRSTIHLAQCLLSVVLAAGCGDDSGDGGATGDDASSTTEDPSTTEAGSTTEPSSTTDPGTTDGTTTTAGSSSTGPGSSSSDDSSSGEPVADASIRLFHAAIQSDGNPNAGFGAGAAIELDLDVYIDGTLELEGLALTDASVRLPVTSGDHEFIVQASDTDEELFTGSVSILEGESTLVVYNAAADFTAETVELALFAVDESQIEAPAAEAGFLAVHLDGNAQAQVFRAYSDLNDAEGVVALGEEYGYQDADGSGVYGVSDVAKAYLDSDAGPMTAVSTAIHQGSSQTPRTSWCGGPTASPLPGPRGSVRMRSCWRTTPPVPSRRSTASRSSAERSWGGSCHHPCMSGGSIRLGVVQ